MKQLPEGTMDGVDEQIFAIGDIHGELASMEAALEYVRENRDPSRTSHLIFLGDLVDRGADGMKCMKMAWDACERTGVDKRTVLIGNHEMMMFHSITPLADGSYDDFMGMNWVKNGGASVIREVTEASGSTKGIEQQVRDAIPEGMLEHMVANTHHRAGNLIFVHAGLIAGLDSEDDLARYLARPPKMEDGDKTHWAWVREDYFLEYGRVTGWGPDRNLIVVHGHTPVGTDPQSSAYTSYVKAHRSGQVFEKSETEMARALLEALNSSDHHDLVNECGRINMDGGCGKYKKHAAPVPVLQLKDNQYHIEMTLRNDLESKPQAAPSPS
ncbi:metallophosphoesterase [Sulfitobacter sp. R18_1]|uniref:metallophosphoesterase n=1 Tax=Sulfitobacter sp. R18_1 TaxID=2821104 RepID=UPI001ADAF17D|nr:metallophosphoesterase [Sulfitobacter sp. R18_1]MBO9427951.1 metallophosphoesterase [Sulfitobacter sp. R18_1]